MGFGFQSILYDLREPKMSLIEIDVCVVFVKCYERV